MRCHLLEMTDPILTSMPDLSKMAVRLLIDRQTLDIFDVVGDREMSAKQIGDALGKTTKDIWYPLRQLVKAELLIEAGLKKRKGRPQKLYRISAKSFFIPADQRTNTVGQNLGAKLLECLEHGDDALGEHFYFDGSKWRVEKIYEQPRSRTQLLEEFWMVTELSPENADQFAADVRKIFDKYQKKKIRSKNRTLVHFAFAPLP